MAHFACLAALAALTVVASANNCTFIQGQDCTDLLTPPGFIRNFGTGPAAEQACCDLCAGNPKCYTAVLATDQGGVCMLKPFGTRCTSGHHNRVGCSIGNPINNPLVPKWSPTYNMSESTVVMPCNYTGLYDYEAYPELAQFGLVDYDWANAKSTWVNLSPMDCDGMLVQQAARNKAINPTAKVFVYRNIVKALPWYTEVRELLQNQSYWGWFIPYEGCKTDNGDYICKNNETGAIDASSNLYHDQQQTPGWTGGGNGGPDGICHNDTTGNTGKGCDCGANVSCGEYLWNHRNSSLQQWFVDVYIGGSIYGLGNENVDGYYLDDHWSDRGPSEEHWPCSARGTGAGKCSGFTKNDTAEMISAWQINMDTVQAAIVEKNGFDWQNFQTISTPSKQDCAEFLRNECQNGSQSQTAAVRHAIGYKYWPDFSGGNLTNFDMDLATFLASRGPYGWLGYGWMGCGCGWEHNGKMPCDIYQRPKELNLDYGEPMEMCHETTNGVFVREWTKSTVTVDCNAYTSTIKFK